MVFGSFERGTGRVFMVTVQQKFLQNLKNKTLLLLRSKDTLFPIIQE